MASIIKGAVMRWAPPYVTKVRANILALPKQFIHPSCCTIVGSCERSTPTPASLAANEMGSNSVYAGGPHFGQRGGCAFSFAGVEDSSSSLFHLHSRP